MDESKSNQGQEEVLRFSQEQYDMLKRCSDIKDITEWNNWRKNNQDVDIELEFQSFNDFYLEDACLNKLRKENSEYEYEVHKGNVYLNGSTFKGANLKNANLRDARLKGASLSRSNLNNTCLETIVVDGETSIWRPQVNCYSKGRKYTDCEGVPLDVIRIDPRTKQILEYNIRLKNWQKWYTWMDWHKDKPSQKRTFLIRFLMLFIRGFWSISDYGISTRNIIRTFFSLAVIFAGIYFVWGAFDYFLVGNEATPGIVSHLFVNAELESQVHPICYSFMVLFRAIYFSVVTMTTLGFGDMYANAENGWLALIVGHLLLILQVILGYVLLGALVTRFAVLFTAGGPVGKFPNES